MKDLKTLLEGSLLADVEDTLNDKTIVYKKRVPILEKCIDKYFDLNPKDKNKLLKSMIRKIEYSKTQGGRYNESNMNLNIFYKISVN